MLRLLLALCALTLASPACAEWWEARTDHFIVYSESSRKDAKEFAEKLERFDQALRSLQSTKFDPPTSDSQRLTVFRTGDIGYIGNLAGSSGVAGFYIPRMGGSVAFTPARGEKPSLRKLHRDSRTDLDPQSVLFHEYAHHFMFQHFPAAYPSWYVEGFAETAATIDLKDDGSFHLGNPPQYRSDALFRGMLTVNARNMLTIDHKPSMEDYYGYYTVGWLLNHYLTFAPNRQGQLKTYLRLINAGTEPAEAARQAFGDLDELDSELGRYKTGGRLGGVDVKPANYSPPKVSLRQLTEAEEAVMRVKIRTKRGVDRKTAEDAAGDARRVAAEYPDSFPVLLELAEAELDAGHYEAADAAAMRAIALKPDSAEALLLKARSHFERGDKDNAQYGEARRWLARAHDADPYHPAPLFYNYLTYFREGGAIPESALIGLERAYDAALYDPQLRLVLARQLLAEKKGALARQILLPVSLNPHESKQAKALREVVDLIEAKKLDEAYGRLASKMKEWEDKAKNGS